MDDKDYHIQHLEDQLTHYRRGEDRRHQEQQQARKEIVASAREALSHADNWEQAFRNNAIRFADEVSESALYKNENPDDDWDHVGFFKEELAANKKAQEIYNKLMVEAKKKIAELEKAVVANTLKEIEKAYKDKPEPSVINALREDDPAGYVYW